MTAKAAHRRALQSLLDVVEELAAGLAAGQTPERDWAAIVTETFEGHRRELLETQGDE